MQCNVWVLFTWLGVGVGWKLQEATLQCEDLQPVRQKQHDGLDCYHCSWVDRNVWSALLASPYPSFLSPRLSSWCLSWSPSCLSSTSDRPAVTDPKWSRSCATVFHHFDFADVKLPSWVHREPQIHSTFLLPWLQVLLFLCQADRPIDAKCVPPGYAWPEDLIDSRNLSRDTRFCRYTWSLMYSNRQVPMVFLGTAAVAKGHCYTLHAYAPHNWSLNTTNTMDPSTCY